MIDFIRNFPFFSIILSLCCAVTTFVLPKKPARILSLSLFGVCMALSGATLLRNLYTGEGFVYRMGHFDAPFGNEIAAGLLEPACALLFGTVLFCSVLAGKERLLTDIAPGKERFYYIMADLAHVALLALCYTNDIFTGYVFVEICTLSSAGLLMIRGTGKSLAAATRYMIFSLIGSGLFLLGVIFLYGITGHLLFPQLHETVAEIHAAGTYAVPLLTSAALMTGGLAVKSGLFPFHFWMPDTYGTAIPSSSGILSGVISKAYIFLLLKVIYRVLGTDVYFATGAQNILYLFGVCGIVIGSLSAIRQTRLSRMVAYSSAAQIGYIYMGIGLGSAAGITASFFQIFAHALTKPLLFLSGAKLRAASGGSDAFRDLRGAAHRDRGAGLAFAVGSLSMIGLPIFAGFIPKLLFALAAMDSYGKAIPTLVVLAVSTILNVIYFLHTVITIYLPVNTQPQLSRRRPDAAFLVGALLLVVINVAIGMHSQPITSLIEQGLSLFAD